MRVHAELHAQAPVSGVRGHRLRLPLWRRLLRGLQGFFQEDHSRLAFTLPQLELQLGSGGRPGCQRDLVKVQYLESAQINSIHATSSGFTPPKQLSVQYTCKAKGGNALAY